MKNKITTVVDSWKKKKIKKKKIKNEITNMYIFMKKKNYENILLVFYLYLKHKDPKKHLFSSFLFLRTCLGWTCSVVYSRCS